MEKKQKILLIAVIIMLLIALALCIEIIWKYDRDLKALTKENQELKDKQIETVGTDTTNVVSEEEEEDFSEATKEDVFENRQDIIERVLKMYGLIDNGVELLYTEKDDLYSSCLFIYDTQKDIDEMLKESGETVNINGTEYKLYATGKDYKDYEDAIEEVVGKAIFDKYFTIFAKNINGELYIVNDLGKEETEKFEVKELKETGENEYELTYTYKNGETEEEKTTKVVFTENEDGLDVITQIEL